MQHTHTPRVTVGMGTAQPLLYCTVMVTHYTNPMQVLRTVFRSLLPECSLHPNPIKIQSSQIKIDFYSTPLHRLIEGHISRCFVCVLIIKRKKKKKKNPNNHTHTHKHKHTKTHTQKILHISNLYAFSGTGVSKITIWKTTLTTVFQQLL